ncbi:MAG: deoxynucleoside kinase, partial [Bacteroidota bacterium]
REYEQQISDEYLLSIQQAYFDYFRTQDKTPVLIIDLEDADFAENQLVYQKIIELLQGEYEVGLSRRQL